MISLFGLAQNECHGEVTTHSVRPMV